MFNTGIVKTANKQSNKNIGIPKTKCQLKIQK